jgi:hypothetical protein
MFFIKQTTYTYHIISVVIIMKQQQMGPRFSTIPSEAVPNSVAIHMARPLIANA